MTKAEKVAIWRNRIETAKAFRQEFRDGEDPDNGCYGSQFARDAYNGKTKPAWWSPKDPWVNVNKVKSAIRAGVPSLLYSNPRFKVTPRRPILNDQGVDVSWNRARAQSEWLTTTWQESHGNQHARNAITNAYLGFGALKAGYCPSFKDDEKRGVFALNENGDFILGPDGIPELERGEYATDEDGNIVFDEDGLPVLHPGEIQSELFFVDNIDFDNFLFDVSSGSDFFNHRFVIEEWSRPLKQVREDPRFVRSRRKRVNATHTIDMERMEGGSPWGHTRPEIFTSAVEEDEGLVRGYDIYDFENKEYLVLPDLASDTKTNNEFLMEDDLPAGTDHGPYRFLKFTESDGDKWYPIPDAIDMALVNQEYNITRSQMMIHREHTKTRYLETPGAFDVEGSNADEERAKFIFGEDGVLIRVSDPTAIQPAPKAQLDASFFQAIPNIAADFNDIAGQPGEARGVADADTATQASILATGNELRNSDRRDNQVQTFLAEVGKMLLRSARANAENDLFLKVQTRDGKQPFVFARVDREVLEGDYDVEVEIGSTLPTNDPRAIQQLITYLQALGQNPGLGMYPGLNARVIDSLNLDPVLAEEIAQISQQILQQQNQSQGEQSGAVGQQLLDQVVGGGSAAMGAPTGAPAN